MDSRFVLYLDLLGFGHYVTTDPSGAAHLLNAYMSIFQFAVSKEHNASQQYIDEHDLSDLELFLPFSDSVFAFSKEPQHLLHKIGNFLYSSLMQYEHQYGNPEDPNNPYATTIANIGVSPDGVVTREEMTENWYPPLFRGGLSFGPAASSDAPFWRGTQRGQVPLPFGPAVVAAVRLEQKALPGPRILLTEEAAARLRHVHPNLVGRAFGTQESLDEFYWPAATFTADMRMTLQNEIFRLLVVAANLYKPQKDDPKVGKHYLALIQLVCHSALLYFVGAHGRDDVLSGLREILDRIAIVPFETIFP